MSRKSFEIKIKYVQEYIVSKVLLLEICRQDNIYNLSY